jgi:hypothetical protein
MSRPGNHQHSPSLLSLNTVRSRNKPINGHRNTHVNLVNANESRSFLLEFFYFAFGLLHYVWSALFVCSSRKQGLPVQVETDHHLNSIIGREGIIERLRDEAYEVQTVPNFQRVTISGEETSGVSKTC